MTDTTPTDSDHEPKLSHHFPGLLEIMRALNDVSKAADKRASTFLLSLGATLLVLAFLVKLKPFGLRVTDIQPSEFISVLVICLGCLLIGAYVRMWQERILNDHELRKLELALRYSREIQGATTDAIADLQATVTKAIGDAHNTASQPVRGVIPEAPQRRPGG